MTLSSCLTKKALIEFTKASRYTSKSSGSVKETWSWETHLEAKAVFLLPEAEVCDLLIPELIWLHHADQRHLGWNHILKRHRYRHHPDRVMQSRVCVSWMNETSIVLACTCSMSTTVFTMFHWDLRPSTMTVKPRALHFSLRETKRKHFISQGHHSNCEHQHLHTVSCSCCISQLSVHTHMFPLLQIEIMSSRIRGKLLNVVFIDSSSVGLLNRL